MSITPNQPDSVRARHRERVLRAILLSAAAGAALPLTAAPALAQEEPPAASSGASGPEIFVIARKREEAFIDVPVIETVLTEATIERAAITDINDIAKFAPGLQVGQNVLSTGTQISIRGYGTSASDPGVDQSVALSIDGFIFSQGLAFQSGMFDLEQIEVLRGPQALFFGKSSPGGVIALRTADPGDALEVIARAGYEFEAREMRGELVVSTPIGEGLGVRLAGQVWDKDVFFFNRATAAPNSGGRDPRERLGAGNGYQLRGTVLLVLLADPNPHDSGAGRGQLVRRRADRGWRARPEVAPARPAADAQPRRLLLRHQGPPGRRHRSRFDRRRPAGRAHA